MIKAKKTLFVTVDGRSSFKQADAPGSLFTQGDNVFASYVEAVVRLACIEQSWKVTEEPLYLYINMYTLPTCDRNMYDSRKYMWFNPSYPKIDAMLAVLFYRLKGIVYKNSAQICAVSVRKKYVDANPRLEMFFGIPSHWEEIEHDLSFAEEKSEELEKQQE